MQKFMFFTDLHLAGETPKHRLDDFPKTLIQKLNETYQVAERECCEFVAFGGDWFNYYRIFSFDLLSDAMDIVCGSKLKTYVVVGEHDLYGHNIDTFPSSTLSFFSRQCSNMEVLWNPTEVGDVVLYGKHEPDKMSEVPLIKTDPSKINVLVCHELITCDSAPYDVIDTKTIGKTGFDLIVSGDLHNGYKPHCVNGTWYCNPGSMARRATSDAHRFPQVAIVSISKGKDPDIELRRLECGKAGSEVFGESVTEMLSKTEVSMDSSKFVDDILKFESESSDIHDLIQIAGKDAGLRECILAYLATKRGTNERK